jgi:glycosyltransferase involved in cell wall biosynthesis
LGGWIRRHGGDVLIAGTHFVSGRIPVPQVVHHHNLWRFITPELGVEARRGMAERVRDWSSLQGLRLAAGNVFVSNFIRRQAEKFDATRTETFYVMPNGVDDDLIEAARQAPVPMRRTIAPTLIAVQSANVQKDNVTLIRTLAELAKRAPHIDWRLQIAGSSGRAGWLPFHELARELGVHDRMEWLGFLGPGELRACEERALCLVATSRLESSGLPLIEAMSARCPVVATDIPAFEEYASGAAELVPPGDHRAFAEAILRLYNDPDRRVERIEQGLDRAWHYRWSAWAPVMIQAVQEAASRTAIN